MGNDHEELQRDWACLLASLRLAHVKPPADTRGAGAGVSTYNVMLSVSRRVSAVTNCRGSGWSNISGFGEQKRHQARHPAHASVQQLFAATVCKNCADCCVQAVAFGCALHYRPKRKLKSNYGWIAKRATDWRVSNLCKRDMEGLAGLSGTLRQSGGGAA